VTLLGSFVRFGAASSAVTTEAPHWRESRRGRIPEEHLALYEGGPVTLCSQPKSSPFWINLVGTWLAREWPVKRRRKGVNGDGGVNLGSLELNDFLPAIERDGNFKMHLDVLARVPDRGFGAEKFIEVFALDVLSIHQARQ
jgi:hypothetical protein